MQKQPPEVFCKKGDLKNFAKFTGKHLCQSLFFNKVNSLGPSTLIKKRFFSATFAKIFNNTLFTEHLWTTASVYKVARFLTR